MRSFILAAATVAALATGSAQAALYQESIAVNSPGAWSTNLLGGLQFTLDNPGQYVFGFTLTPNAGSNGLLASLHATLTKQNAPGAFIQEIAANSNVGDDSFAGSLTFDHLGGAGQYSFMLNFTNWAPWNGTLTYTVSPVPEPATMALVGLGAAGVAWRRRRQAR
ncbi:PEP-CTERM sorting domain-containing protein [Chitiniphilus purpureus]|uniref:PEP-CTERM sorting domain-containing protein n=1 Tax=Chitiniphilus purpureus TaxID=2981137 RepID=A0ABY6DR18_9NEIS|nr:PEP-CTERM sorting domain-containing protein [Chitiniphilus sp. CD1]UXY16804.1 PEP-CTERM sorting domain-containing protein [Chitiniphilus sp. CD1]